MTNPWILLTGFGAFDGRYVNGAESVARACHGLTVAGHRIETRLLNVVWKDVSRFCENTLPELDPALVLCLGEADRPYPTFESLGVAAAEGTDVRGEAPPAGALSKPSEERTSGLRFDANWFADDQHKPQLSTDAGRYLCNWMLYHGLVHSSSPLGFLHLPIQGNVDQEVYVSRYQDIVLRLLQQNLISGGTT